LSPAKNVEQGLYFGNILQAFHGKKYKYLHAIVIRNIAQRLVADGVSLLIIFRVYGGEASNSRGVVDWLVLCLHLMI